jgi:hypothetical protein
MFFVQEMSEINSRKNTMEVIMEKEDSEYKMETRGPMRLQIGCTMQAHR